MTAADKELEQGEGDRGGKDELVKKFQPSVSSPTGLPTRLPVGPCWGTSPALPGEVQAGDQEETERPVNSTFMLLGGETEL